MTNNEYLKAVKLKLVEMERGELEKKTKFPKKIRLDQASLITDPNKFFDSHLCIIEASEGRIKDIFGRRLAIALTSVGIDVFELRKKAEKQIRSDN